MALDDFYEKIGEDDRRLGKIAFGSLLCFCILCAGVVYLLSSGRGYSNPQKSTAEERLKRVDELCANLPKPEKLVFRSREQKNYPNSSFVSYSYASDRTPEEIVPFFTIWFNSNGWNNWKSITGDFPVFRKDKQTVIFTTYSPDDVRRRYEIVCSETE